MRKNKNDSPELMITGLEDEISWTGEKVRDVPTKRWIYRIACLFLWRRRLTYKEMFALLYGLYEKKMGEKAAKVAAVQRIISIYEYNNKKLPEGIEHDS